MRTQRDRRSPWRVKIGAGVMNLAAVGFVFAAIGSVGAGAALLRDLPSDAPVYETVSRLSLSQWLGGASVLIGILLMLGCLLMLIGSRLGRLWAMWSCLLFALLTLSQSFFAIQAYLAAKPSIENLWAFLLPVIEITGDAVLHSAFPFMLGIVLAHPAIRDAAKA